MVPTKVAARQHSSCEAPLSGRSQLLRRRERVPSRLDPSSDDVAYDLIAPGAFVNCQLNNQLLSQRHLHRLPRSTDAPLLRTFDTQGDQGRNPINKAAPDLRRGRPRFIGEHFAVAVDDKPRLSPAHGEL